MADLKNQRWEAFAQARAQGMTMSDAYRDAGYRFNRSAASRLAKKPAVASRIRTLLIQREALHEARLAETIVALLALAGAADPKSAVALKEARAARLEAHRLGLVLAEQSLDRTPAVTHTLSKQAWLAEYGRNALTAGN